MVEGEAELMVSPEALSLLEGVAGPRRMKITDADISRGELIYSVHCVCDMTFQVSRKTERVKCPNCKREAYLFSLLRDWRD